MPGLIGKEIGKYRITKLIGRGGMAEVSWVSIPI